jgi:MSHA biogenesis protein MshI
MFFKRRRVERAQILGVARTGNRVTAAGVGTNAEGGLALNWLWSDVASGMPEVIRGLQQAWGPKLPPSVLVADRGEYTLVATEAPEVPREEWREALRWQLKDQVTYPIDNAIIEVLAVPEATQVRASHASIVLIAPHDEANRNYLQSSDEGHDWVAHDVPETALRNICALGEVEGKAHALMAFGDTYSMLVITCGGELLMARTIEVSLNDPDDPEEHRGGAIGRAGLEVLRTLDTFERIHSQAQLAHVTVALPPGFDGAMEVLADLVYQPLKALHLGELLDCSQLRDQGVAMAATFAELCAIGGALRQYATQRGTSQISLLPPALQGGPVSWNLDHAARACAALAGLAFLGSLGLSGVAVTRMVQADAAEKSASSVAEGVPQGAPRPPIMIELEALRETSKRQSELRESLGKLANEQSGHYSQYLMALARQAPGSLWIVGLDIAPNGRDMELRGRLMDPLALPAYLGKLAAEPQFRGRRFTQVELKSLDGSNAAFGDTAGLQGVSEFVLKASAKSEPAATAGGLQP